MSKFFTQIIFFYALSGAVWGQNPPSGASGQSLDSADYQHIINELIIDSIVVSAPRFDMYEFIKMIEQDETFYNAFANLRHVSYQADNQIDFYNNKTGKSIASYTSLTQQLVDTNDCRVMKTHKEEVKGRFYKKKRKNKPQEHRYYTSMLYEKLFFTQGKVCNQATNTTPTGKKSKKMGMVEHHIEELKKLIFKPGQKADVPFIGTRTAIFSPKMAKYYTYRIQEKQYKGMDCHVFIIEPKPEYLNKKQDKTVIKYLETYFEKLTHQVVARNYELSFRGVFYFDVKMNIEVSKISPDIYIPTQISYDGSWQVPTQKPETCKFLMRCDDFVLPNQTAKK